MKKYLPFIVLVVVSFVFFYKTIFQFKVPFPGDILIADYFPFKYESYLGYNPGSYPNKAQYFDVIRQMYPWKIFAIEELKAGNFPLWNPYNFSGMPLFANNQSAVLNPFNLLFFALSPPAAWTIFIYLQPLLASIFTYLYLRKLSLTKTSALIGAVAFSYSLYMSVFLEYGNFGYSILYLPLLLLSIEKLFESKKSLFGPLISLIVAFVAFSGHLQLFGGIILFLFIYSVARFFMSKKDYEALRPNGRGFFSASQLKLSFQKHSSSSIRSRISALADRNLILIIFYLILGIGLSMVQLLPTTELLNNSARVNHDSGMFQKNILLQVQQLILFFAPDAYGNPAVGNYLLKDSYPGNAIYIGIIPLIFALFSLFKYKKNKYVVFFSIVSVFLLLFLTNNPVSKIFYSLNIPFLSASAPSNYIFLLSFALSVLCAFGINEWTKKYDKKIFFVTAGFFLLFILLFATNKLFGTDVLLKQLVLGSGFLAVSVAGILLVYVFKKKVLIYVLLIILVGDLFYYFIKFNPFVPSSIVFPQTPLTTFLKQNNKTRVWGYSAANMQPNFQTYYNIYSPEGYDPLYPKWYGKFIYATLNGKLLSSFSENTRSDALVVNGYGERDLRENALRLKMLDNLGVGLILDRPESATTKYTFDEKRFEKVYDINNFSVYKNLGAKERIYMTTEYQTYSSDEDFENKFFKNDILLLEKKPGIEIVKGEAGSSKILLNKPNKIIISTNSKTNSMLVLLDTYYPGWSASVDGVKTEILKANYTFRAIALDKGEHNIIFEYKPQSFYWGTIITIISSIVTICIYLYTKKFIK